MIVSTMKPITTEDSDISPPNPSPPFPPLPFREGELDDP